MTNTNNINRNQVQEVAEAVMQDLKKRGTVVETKEDVFNAVRNYVNLTKEQFEVCYKEAEKVMKEDDVETRELEAEELDTVVGGIPDWLKVTLGVVGTVAGVAIALFGACLAVGEGPAAGYLAIAAGCTLAFASLSYAMSAM